MAGYLGTKAVFLSTTASSVTGNASVGGDFTVDTNTLHVDSTNNRVGIGTTSPDTALTVSGGDIKATGSLRNQMLVLARTDAANDYEWQIQGGSSGDKQYLAIVDDKAGASQERFRLDDSGAVMVGTTTRDVGFGNTATGTNINPVGYFIASRANGQAAHLNRNSDGNIVTFAKDGTTVGSIGVNGGVLDINSSATSTDGPLVNVRSSSGTAVLTLGVSSDFYGFIGDSSGNAVGMSFVSYRVQPQNAATGLAADNQYDIGYSTARWDDIYATNGTIQTSDRNEKQQIASLTDAEMQAAKAISALFKTFKWNDAVESKGDAARKHAGVIAQDVQQAMADAGLDAGDYAFFISSTWWETQTEVPAVEAVAAQDAVYDEEGNLISEAVEAVEAKDAYTRTDTYDTLEEAPEGATERTRLGIRYPELLAFIGAATEQRLASIEARLDAIEGV